MTAANWVPARPTPPQFKSSRFALTFKTPKNSSYCPLRKAWRGTDNGTTMFLVAPMKCGLTIKGPSTNRSFSPNPLPMISVSYNYVGVARPAPCAQVDKVKIMGRTQPVCEIRRGGTLIRSIRGTYIADIPSEVMVTLVTTPMRLKKDMDALKRVTGSLRACTAMLQGPRGGFTIGRGKACPAAAVWF
nr:hypothetical protein [uncultured Sphingomonas sp.]